MPSDNPKDAERLARLRELYKGCAETDDHQPVGIGHPVFLLRLLTDRDATIARLRAELDFNIGMNAFTVGEYDKLKSMIADLEEAARAQEIHTEGQIRGLVDNIADLERRLAEAEQAGVERAIRIIESGRFLHDDAPGARFAKEVVAAIRRATPPPPVAEASGESAPHPIRDTEIMTEAQIKHMVTRFLGWRLPGNFSPDGGIFFHKTFNEHTAHPMDHEPSGTNLFDAAQAEAMVRHMVEDLPPQAPQPTADHTERARELVADWRAHVGWDNALPYLEKLVTAALTAAERAGAEKMRALDEAVVEAATTVLTAFKEDARKGYVTRDKNYAIAILGRALAARDAAQTQKERPGQPGG